MNTASKRFAAINVGCPWRGLGYLPSGSIGAEQRAAAAFLYGMDSDLPVPETISASRTYLLEGENRVYVPNDAMRVFVVH